MFRDGNRGKVAHLKLSKCWISLAYCELCSNSPLYFSESHENTIFLSLSPVSAKRFIFIYYSLSKVILLIIVDVKNCIKHLTTCILGINWLRSTFSEKQHKCLRLALVCPAPPPALPGGWRVEKWLEVLIPVPQQACRAWAVSHFLAPERSLEAVVGHQGVLIIIRATW